METLSCASWERTASGASTPTSQQLRALLQSGAERAAAVREPAVATVPRASYPEGHELADAGLQRSRGLRPLRGDRARTTCVAAGWQAHPLQRGAPGADRPDRALGPDRVMEYPGTDAFVDMIRDPDYQAGLVHRDAGLAETAHPRHPFAALSRTRRDRGRPGERPSTSLVSGHSEPRSRDGGSSSAQARRQGAASGPRCAVSAPSTGATALTDRRACHQSEWTSRDRVATAASIRSEKRWVFSPSSGVRGAPKRTAIGERRRRPLRDALRCPTRQVLAPPTRRSWAGRAGCRAGRPAPPVDPCAGPGRRRRP